MAAKVATIEQVLEIIERDTGIKIFAESTLDGMELDSLEYLEMIVALRELGEIPDSCVAYLNTPLDILKVLNGQLPS